MEGICYVMLSMATLGDKGIVELSEELGVGEQRHYLLWLMLLP